MVRGPAQAPCAARLTGAATAEKRKFTFRIDPARHADFCRAAETRNVSRQRLLTEALDELLKRLGHRTDQTGSGVPRALQTKCRPSGVAPSLPGSGMVLPPPL